MASIAGVQPKVTVRLIDGQYIAGWTPEELQERYEICEDSATKLLTAWKPKTQGWWLIRALPTSCLRRSKNATTKSCDAGR